MSVKSQSPRRPRPPLSRRPTIASPRQGPDLGADTAAGWEASRLPLTAAGEHRESPASVAEAPSAGLVDHRVEIRSTIDIVSARQHGRELALNLGFSAAEIALIAAAISEVVRNMVDHADGGEVTLCVAQRGATRGLQVVARDRGPGIADLPRAMQYGYSSRQGLGVGLPGAKWLMDDFEISTKVGEGTTVVMHKWLKRSGA